MPMCSLTNVVLMTTFTPGDRIQIGIVTRTTDEHRVRTPVGYAEDHPAADAAPLMRPHEMLQRMRPDHPRAQARSFYAVVFTALKVTVM